MSIIDDAASTLKDVFLGKADSWHARLEGELTLKSPKGTTFKPHYQGSDSFKVAKRVAEFSLPLINGTLVQDMGSDGLRISLSVFFSGKNNDVSARALLSTCRTERGLWELTHPVHGFYKVQLLSVELTNTNDGVTYVNTEWVEALDPVKLKTARELKGIVDAQINSLNTGALSQFVDTLNTTTASLKNVVKTTTQGIQNVVDWALYPLKGTVRAVDDALLTVHHGINASLMAVTLPIAQLAGQIQQLIEIPGLAKNDYAARAECYENMILGLTNLLPSGSTTPLKKTATKQQQINNILTVELGLSSCISALSRTITTSVYTSRDETIDAANKIIELYNSAVESLEAQQSLYLDQYLVQQYFRQSATYTNATILVMNALSYLQRISYDLKIKQVITLIKPTTPIELAVTYYGDFEKLTYLVETNGLKGTEIVILPAGKEVIIYV